MRTGTELRALRTAVFASVCALLSALGHASMSGAPLPWWVVAGAAALTAAGVWWPTGRERGSLRVGATALATQALLHGVFSLAQVLLRPVPSRSFAGQWVAQLLCAPPHPADAMNGGAARAGRSGGVADALAHGSGGGMSPVDHGHPAGHAQHLAHGAADPMAGMDGMHAAMDGMAAGGGAVGMVAVHVLIALAGAVWLCGAERATFRLLRAVSARLFAPLSLAVGGAAPVPDPLPVRRAAWEARPPFPRLLLAHVISTRGPPRVLAVR
ncbi:PE-PGRS family protein [Streptomyces sp. NPDC001922]|uniref:PE-PGRS family protein n=1 Tax=Streptomyces sp. NPDC001922 TaxID=3364624 RepID=UPI003688422D